MEWIRYLAVVHRIFVSIEPYCDGWRLMYKFRIQEPEYDKFLHQGYKIVFDYESGEYSDYDTALTEAKDYIRSHVKWINDKTMTLIE